MPISGESQERSRVKGLAMSGGDMKFKELRSKKQAKKAAKERRKERKYSRCSLCGKASFGLTEYRYCSCVFKEEKRILINGSFVKYEKFTTPKDERECRKIYWEKVNGGIPIKPFSKLSRLEKKSVKLVEKKVKRTNGKFKPMSRAEKKKFYESREWLDIRYQVLKRDNFMCQVCGATKLDGKLHVDHIKPLSLYPKLKLDKNNLQVLCEKCNLGKSNLH